MYHLYNPNFTRTIQSERVIKPITHTIADCTLTPSQLFAKRVLDIVVAIIALILVLPVMLVVAIFIRMDFDGPILFTQKRVGMNGKLFTIYKFRTMVANAEALQTQINMKDANGRTLHKRPDDPRVTRIGRSLRKLSLDELPQLFNVIKGDMSLVGPRPELPWLVSEYSSRQRRRFTVPQGITGWWQIHERSDAPMHINGQRDLDYIENYSLWLDIKIIAITVPALLRQKGAF